MHKLITHRKLAGVSGQHDVLSAQDLMRIADGILDGFLIVDSLEERTEAGDRHGNRGNTGRVLMIDQWL